MNGIGLNACVEDVGLTVHTDGGEDEITCTASRGGVQGVRTNMCSVPSTDTSTDGTGIDSNLPRAARCTRRHRAGLPHAPIRPMNWRSQQHSFAALSGCSVALVDGKNGLMTSEQVSSSIRKAEGSLSHYPNGSLVCVENTAQGGGGSVYSQEAIDDICKVAREKDCKLHMDGARLFNASVASNTDPARMVRDFDSISICLSKGLGAPIGSVLVGSKEDLAQAHRWRKMFGGGMRQAGMMAAAGIYALENNIDRLREDHRRARKFAESLVEMPNFLVNLETVQSNIVYIGVGKGKSKQIIEKLAKQDIDILDTDDSTIRAVFHLHIGDEDLEKIIEVFAQLR